ncbi:MAG TPA: sugar phosphate isomerase/epimerase [Solibacterales bacterium]|nr:sugar phosphate isomerase/epimerase [Bryobacterales bacterium]
MFRIGAMDGTLRLREKVEAFEVAKRAGLEGVEFNIGREPVEGRLALDDAAKQRSYLEASQQHGVAIAGIVLDILHRNYLKNDKLAEKWVAESIPIAQKLDVKVVLLPMFSKGALTNQDEMNYVADVLKNLAPAAEKASITLGLENTISAADNVRIIERAGSPALKVYYDVGNSTNRGFDILAEIRWLGKDRICQMHLKDNPYYLGEGRINFPAVIRAMKDIGYDRWANLETESPSKDAEADARRNTAYLRKLM